ncbi:hypothetical protein [Thauera humireducens]|uniref:hypothetical protein n=1 Tax=Thauera humireducens TaxID=1134435 RepID=UPI00311FC708
MSESEYKKLRDDNADMPIVDFLGLLIADWGKGASEEFGAFSVDALREVADAYPGAPHAIHSAYVVSRYQGRTGN